MRVTWEVEDGYVGKSSPQFTEIPDEDFEDFDGEICENKEERQEIIDNAVQNDFDQKISWAIVRIEE